MKLDEMAAGVRAFLRAAGQPDEGELAETPRRVAELWAHEVLAGYAMDPAAILNDSLDAAGERGLVMLTGLSFHSMCPHHLMPAHGRAHVAYLPGSKLLGLGQIAQLVTCFTRRLTLQERAARAIVDALMTLPVRGAGCVLEARQLCLALPGDRHDGSQLITSAFAGALDDDAPGARELQARLLAACDRR